MGFLDKMTKKLNDKLNETPPKKATYKSGGEQHRKHGTSRPLDCMIRCHGCGRSVNNRQSGQGLCTDCI